MASGRFDGPRGRPTFRKAVQPSQPPACSCCIAVQALVRSTAMFACGAGLIWLLSILSFDPAGPWAGFNELKPVLRWPVLLWMGLVALALIGEALRCLKLPPEKLFESFFGRPKPQSGASTAAPVGSGVEHTPGMVPLAAAATAAVALTIAIKPQVEQPDPVDLPVHLAPSASGPATIPVRIDGQASAPVQVQIDLQMPSRKSIDVEWVTKPLHASVAVDPDGRLVRLAASLEMAAQEMRVALKDAKAQHDDLQQLVRGLVTSSQNLVATSSRSLVLSDAASLRQERLARQVALVAREVVGQQKRFLYLDDDIRMLEEHAVGTGGSLAAYGQSQLRWNDLERCIGNRAVPSIVKVATAQSGDEVCGRIHKVIDALNAELRP